MDSYPIRTEYTQAIILMSLGAFLIRFNVRVWVYFSEMKESGNALRFEKKTVEMLHKINLFLFGFGSAALITPSHFFTF